MDRGASWADAGWYLGWAASHGVPWFQALRTVELAGLLNDFSGEIDLRSGTTAQLHDGGILNMIVGKEMVF